MISDLFTQAVALAKEHDKIQPRIVITQGMITSIKRTHPKMTDESARQLVYKILTGESVIIEAEQGVLPTLSY